MKKIYQLLLVILFTLTNSAKATCIEDPIPKHDTFEIVSEQIGETRTINVWIPEEYASTTATLPVLYMADGGLKEDFPHMANTLAQLIRNKKIPAIILVGIENTQRRRDLTGETKVKEDLEIAPVVGGSAKFRAFIKEELFPKINDKYRTTNEKGIIGESLSGLFVVETLMLHPEMFDFYIAFDPSLWWNNNYLLKAAKEFLSHIPAGEHKKFWFAGSGTNGIAPIMKDLEKTLTDKKSPNLEWLYTSKPNEEHHTIFRATKDDALIWTLEKSN